MESPTNSFSDKDSEEERIYESLDSTGVFKRFLDQRVRPYIDLIDTLRTIGIDQDLSLPSIAVVGDQSSGKSSVLEVLSGVALPRGSGIVTRCPLELKLRTQRRGQWKATISYGNFKETFDNPSEVEARVRKAQNELAGDGVGICEDLISLEIMSPDVHDLTLIDLPGITRVPVKGQPEDIGDQIKRLILKYITKSATIVLVVVPCNVDIATTEALRMAQEVDPNGNRTLAILTKPDLIDKGVEIDVLNIVQGKIIPLSKGYIIVKCRGQRDINDKITLAEAVQIEKEFFSTHKYFSSLLNEQKATTHCLARRLTQDLVDHIKKSLPHLAQQVHACLLNVKGKLKEYNEGPPTDLRLMGPFLSQMIIDFGDQIEELSRTGESKQKNLYAQMRPVFKQWESYLSATKQSFKEQMKEMVEKYDESHRGRELLTFSDYGAFEGALKSHVKTLEIPAIDTMRLIRDIVQKEFKKVCDVCFEYYPQLRYIASNKIDDIQSKQEVEVEKRIKEFIKMECLMVTQDSIFVDKLNNSEIIKKLHEGKKDSSSGELDTRGLIPDKLVIYYDIVYQRLADYVPMLIQLFMLKEPAKVLRNQMMELRGGADVVKLLTQDSERGRKRVELIKRLDRLKQAQERISQAL